MLLFVHIDCCIFFPLQHPSLNRQHSPIINYKTFHAWWVPTLKCGERQTVIVMAYCRMPWMWRDSLEEAEGWREAEAHWSRFREMWEGVSETGDDALMAAESWRGRSPGSDSPHPHGASWLTSFSVHCGISLLQLLYEQQPHLSLSHIWAKISIYLPAYLSIQPQLCLFNIQVPVFTMWLTVQWCC